MWEERVHIYGTPEVLNNYPGLNKKKEKKKKEEAINVIIK